MVLPPKHSLLFWPLYSTVLLLLLYSSHGAPLSIFNKLLFSRVAPTAPDSVHRHSELKTYSSAHLFRPFRIKNPHHSTKQNKNPQTVGRKNQTCSDLDSFSPMVHPAELSLPCGSTWLLKTPEPARPPTYRKPELTRRKRTPERCHPPSQRQSRLGNRAPRPGSLRFHFLKPFCAVELCFSH